MLKKTLNTNTRNQMLDITDEVARAIADARIEEGMVTVYSPHTTGAITINEGHDPAVMEDILGHLAGLVPKRREFRHMEGNSDSHIKVAMLGPSQAIPVVDGKMVLGTWQRIFFCEFDGPRTRKYYISFK